MFTAVLHIRNNSPLCFSAPLSFEALQKEERTCRQEITAYEKKIENWSLASKSNPKLPTAPTVKVSYLCFLRFNVYAMKRWCVWVKSLRVRLIVINIYHKKVLILLSPKTHIYTQHCVLNDLKVFIISHKTSRQKIPCDKMHLEFWLIQHFIHSIMFSLRPNLQTETSLQRSERWRLSCRGQEALMAAGTHMTTKPSSK